jgi:hypothetical protein
MPSQVWIKYELRYPFQSVTCDVICFQLVRIYDDQVALAVNGEGCTRSLTPAKKPRFAPSSDEKAIIRVPFVPAMSCVLWK